MKKSLIIMAFCIVSALQASDRGGSFWYRLNEYFQADDDIQIVQVIKENPALLDDGLFNAAIMQKKNRIAKALLGLSEIHARLNQRTFFNGLMFAVTCNEELIRPLLERGASCWASEVLCYAQNATTVTILIDYGANATWADSNGWTALHHAAHKGMYDVVKALIPYSNIYATTILRSTPLDLAQAKPIKQLLRQEGAEE